MSNTIPLPERSCTCHPDDSPPVPCPKKYALRECVTAHAAAVSAADNAALRAELAQAMKERARAIAVGDDMEQEAERLRDQLHLAEVARAAQVEGLAQGAAGWRERSEQLAAEVAGLREALLQCAESLSIFDVRRIVRAALAAGKGEA